MHRVNRQRITESRKRGDVVEFICPRTRMIHQVGPGIVTWSVLLDPGCW